MSKANKSRYALLGMFSLGPMTGYDLKKAIAASIGYFWQEHYAQIYPMLKQLTREGLTTSHIEEQEGKPDRHVYALTDKGREELQGWLALLRLRSSVTNYYSNSSSASNFPSQ